MLDKIMNKIVTTNSASVLGVISPYPTVNIVTQA